MKFQTLVSNSIKYLILFLLLLAPIKINALVEPTTEFYVNDYADVLSDETEDYIVEKGKIMYEQTGAQIVVVTVENLEGESLEDYSIDLARKFEIGSKKDNNGLLLLMAKEERQFRVEVGYGLEGLLPDGKTGRFQDEYIIPYLKDDNFDEGILNGYKAFYKEIAEYYNMDTNVSATKSNTNVGFVIYIVLQFLITFIGYVISIGCDKKVDKFKIFIIMEIASAMLLVISILAQKTGSLIDFGYMGPISIFNLLAATGIIFTGDGSSHSSGGGSFSGGGSSFGGGSSGGGGSFGGGGSSRGF